MRPWRGGNEGTRARGGEITRERARVRGGNEGTRAPSWRTMLWYLAAPVVVSPTTAAPRSTWLALGLGLGLGVRAGG